MGSCLLAVVVFALVVAGIGVAALALKWLGVDATVGLVALAAAAAVLFAVAFVRPFRGPPRAGG